MKYIQYKNKIFAFDFETGITAEFNGKCWELSGIDYGRLSTNDEAMVISQEKVLELVGETADEFIQEYWKYLSRKD